MLDNCVNFANTFIASIIAYTMFILVYGTALFCIIFVICKVVRSIYNWLRPQVEKWLQAIRKK